MIDTVGSHAVRDRASRGKNSASWQLTICAWHQFASLAEAQAVLEAWRMDYNHHRPYRL
ncbi:MAG: integrase core domain-containing protein [Nitrospira sp.]|nr:integrase core domain-containing protein [Nitrospira sp.]